MNTGLLIHFICFIIELYILLKIKYKLTHCIIVEDLIIAVIVSLLGPISLILTLIVYIMVKLEENGILNKRLW